MKTTLGVRAMATRQSLECESVAADSVPYSVVGSVDERRISFGYVGESLVLDGEIYQPGCN